MLPYELQLRAEATVAVNLHREDFLAGRAPSYLDPTVFYDPQSVDSTATAELSTAVNRDARVASTGTTIGTELSLVGRALS